MIVKPKRIIIIFLLLARKRTLTQEINEPGLNIPVPSSEAMARWSIISPEGNPLLNSIKLNVLVIGIFFVEY